MTLLMSGHREYHRVGEGWAGFRLRGGGGGSRYSPLASPPPPIDGPQNPAATDPWAGGGPDPKFGKKKWKWGFWNQRVEGVQKSHHLPWIWWEKIDYFNVQNFFWRRRLHNSRLIVLSIEPFSRPPPSFRGLYRPPPPPGKRNPDFRQGKGRRPHIPGPGAAQRSAVASRADTCQKLNAEQS